MKIPKGLWDSIFLTVQRKTLTGMTSIGIGLALLIFGGTVMLLPAQDYEPVRGRIMMTNEGYVFIPYEFPTTIQKKEETTNGRSETE